MNDAFLVLEVYPDHIKLISKGQWTLKSVRKIEDELQKIPFDKKIIWDVSSVDEFDSAGVLLFIEKYELFQAKTEVEVIGYTSKQSQMYKLLKTERKHKEVIVHPKEGWVEDIGHKTVDFYYDIKEFLSFSGELFIALAQNLLSPRQIRLKETVYHIYHSGFTALMIVSLTAFLVGMVIAYQGSVQLAKFGADIFIVDTVGISMVRELGPMITAIVIAGRSGSSYTAEIGAMKITEEIAAMRTMGFDPYHFLVLPRIFALVIALPLLIFFSDLMGIFGGMVASQMQLGISFDQFVNRLYEVLEVKHYILGMIKGPVFAFLIAAVGCFRGFQVSENTESIGLHTTQSVVNSIFLVIAFDALFSVIYTELDL
ncbi:MAG: ABC transporter permease [Campylobacterales bacterium]|nr:ABC transporter permease [Campylobacterales bacterium]